MQRGKRAQRAQGIEEPRINVLRGCVGGAAVDDAMARRHGLWQVELGETIQDSV
jgi:hypothetical protein